MTLEVKPDGHAGAPAQAELLPPWPRGQLVLVDRSDGTYAIAALRGEIDRTQFFPFTDKETDFKLELLSLSREEVFEIVSAADLPLAGHDHPLVLDWLPDPRECCLGVERQALGDTTLTPRRVYAIVSDLLFAFTASELRLGSASKRSHSKEVYTKGNLEEAQILANAARKLAEAKHTFSKFVPYYKADRDRYGMIVEQIAQELSKKRKRHARGDSENLEEFVWGPLSECYWSLFRRKAGGKANDPFARFGERFFALVGHPVARNTIARAPKDKRRRIVDTKGGATESGQLAAMPDQAPCQTYKERCHTDGVGYSTDMVDWQITWARNAWEAYYALQPEERR